MYFLFQFLNFGSLIICIELTFLLYLDDTLADVIFTFNANYQRAKTGRVDYQGQNAWLTHYFDIDSNAGRPSVENFSIATQPKSILFTQDDRDRYIDMDKLPGFIPTNNYVSSILESSIITKIQESSIAKTNEANEDNSGICKQSHPYLPEAHQVKEDWVFKKDISKKYKDMLYGVEIYGVHPVYVDPKNDYLEVHTQLPGGEDAGRECFKNLTGEYPPLIIDKIYKLEIDGKTVSFRPSGNSGHTKVEINSRYSINAAKIIEKITFQDLYLNLKIKDK